MRIRHAVRSLRQTPWYSLTVIGTIALSMALATTVFAIADGALFRPLPYRNPTQLFLINGPFSQLPSLAQIREWATAAADVRMATYRSPSPLGATASDSPIRVFAAKVGPDFFDVLGQHPILGGFRPEHFVRASGRVPVLLSYGLWQRMFAGSQSVIGQALDLPGAVESDSGRALSFTVAGVLSRDFLYPNAASSPDLILPFALTPAEESDRNRGNAGVVARIPDGVSPESVRTRIDAVVRTQGFRDLNADLRPSGQPVEAGVSLTNVVKLKNTIGIVQYRSAFVAVLVLAGLACMNVVVLGLARSRQRRRDVAVRRALGASRSHLLRQALAETVPLAVAGSAIGFLVAPWLVRAVIALMEARAAVLAPPEVGWRVFAFAALISVVLIATVVLMQQSHWRARSMQAGMGRNTSVTERRGWWAPSLVGFQIALAMVLTIGGTLLVGSLWWAWQQDPGFTPGEAVIVDVSLGNARGADRTALFETLLDRLRAQPGVRAVGLVGGPILRRSWVIPAIVRPSGALPGREQSVGFGGDAFSILGIRPIEGRLFTPDEERSGAPVAVISESVARRFWPGQSAVGQVLQQRGQAPRPVTVVGVVRDARFSGPDDATYAQIYWPLAGAGGSLLVLGDGSADRTLRLALGVIRAIGPISVTHAAAVIDDLGEPMRQRTFAAWLYGGVATSGLLIVGVGLIGFVAMSTTARTKEIGIRSALGATRVGLAAMIMREQLRAVAVGVLAGALAAVWATQYVQRSLYGFGPHDGRLWAIAAGTIFLVALVGSLIPAWRAVRVTPVQALRAD
jgi:putative ABC transport system permease protein